MIRYRSKRRGYALMLVTIFIVLFGAMLGIAWRQVASFLRIEHACEIRGQCDRGSAQALAQAMKVLETRVRQSGSGQVGLDVSSSSTPDYRATSAGSQFVCRSIAPCNISSGTAPADLRWCQVTFTRLGDDGTNWSVSIVVSTAGQDFSTLPPMPNNPP